MLREIARSIVLARYRSCVKQGLDSYSKLDLTCFHIEFGVSLNVLNPVENILEPDDGEYVIVTQCVSAQLDYPLDRDAEFVISDTSTAEVGYDFNTQNITIPANFSGYFSVCLNTTVFGNDVFDGIRKIVYNITAALSVYDIAANPILVITILDNNSECTCAHASLLAIAIPCQASQGVIRQRM